MKPSSHQEIAETVCSPLKAQNAPYLCPWQYTDKPAQLSQSHESKRSKNCCWRTHWSILAFRKALLPLMLQNIAPLPNDCANYRAQTCTAIWHWHESILTYIPVESSRNETFVPTRNMKIVCSRLKAQKALYLCPWQFTNKPARLRQSADHARVSKVVGENTER